MTPNELDALLMCPKCLTERNARLVTAEDVTVGWDLTLSDDGTQLVAFNRRVWDDDAPMQFECKTCLETWQPDPWPPLDYQL